MPLASIFKSFGHAIAAGSKYLAVGLKDAVVVASKAQVIQPEVDTLLTVIAGPQAAKAADLAFYGLGQIAHSLEPLNADQQAAVAANGLNIALDAQTVADIKALVAVIKAVMAARNTPVPAV